MKEFSKRVLYGRGFNIAAQLNPTRKNVPTFTPIEQMADVPIRNLGCGFLQSCYLLENGQFVKAGYFMDSLTSIRIINLTRIAPFVIPFLQKLTFMGKILSFRGGDQQLTLFNGQLDPFEEVYFGGCRVFGITTNKQLYAMGQNYFAQLGTRNIMNYESSFVKIDDINKEKIIGVGCGFQHTLFITGNTQIHSDNNTLYACGKASDYQIQSIKLSQKQQIVEKITQPEAMVKGEKIRKAAGGLKFSLIWIDKNELLAVGHNKFGQCGQNYIKYPEVNKLTPISFTWEPGEQIIDIACGFCHSLILTNKSVYFFGSIEQSQNPFAPYNDNICTPIALPIKNPVKIFANFDRSAIIDEQGNAYLFGGRDNSYCGGQNGGLEVLKGFSKQSLIGLGFAHTLLYP